MKYEDLPEFARPYKKKGYDVRKRKDTFFLYRITSRRVEGKKNPQLVQEYIGIINPDGSLLEKKRRPDEEKDAGARIYLEYGLSSFIYRKCRRELQRSLFSCAGKTGECMVIAATVKYVLGTVSETAIESCRLSAARKDEVMTAAGLLSGERLDRLVNKIRTLLERMFGPDRADFEAVMRLCVCEQGAEGLLPYPEKALEIMERHGVKE